MANRTGTQSEVVDLYEVLEVSPFATVDEIKNAVVRRAQQLANPDSDLSLSDRALLSQLVKIAARTLTKRFELKVKYDIGRMMVRGELVLDQIRLPNPDYPSADVARFRLAMVGRTFEKTMDAVAVAYDDAMSESFLQERVHGRVSEELEDAMRQMRVFFAHAMLDLKTVLRAVGTIRKMGDGAWAQGIRDPRVGGRTGSPTLARRTLEKLRSMEEQGRRRYWVQIARALLTVDPGERRREGPTYGGRLLAILGHLRY